MTQQDGKYTCDKCGGPAGNGGVLEALVVSDLDTSTGQVVNLHFCRTRYDSKGVKTKGCDSSILTKKNLENYGSDYQRPEINKPAEDPQPQQAIESTN